MESESVGPALGGGRLGQLEVLATWPSVVVGSRGRGVHGHEVTHVHVRMGDDRPTTDRTRPNQLASLWLWANIQHATCERDLLYTYFMCYSAYSYILYVCTHVHIAQSCPLYIYLLYEKKG